MENKPLEIRLKNNPNISFELNAPFCSCGRAMFLKKNGQDGSVFWSCKGYHQDENVKLCDLTRDVKCFRCNNGEIRRKQNQETRQFFYGCSNYSTISTSGCNFVLEETELDDVIEQVNDALKFRYNFRSVQFDSVDEKRWEELKKVTIVKNCEVMTTQMPVATANTNIDQNVSVSSESSDSSKKFNLPIPPKLAAYIATGVLLLGLFGILNGSGIKIDLFQGMFKIEVEPAKPTSQNVAVKMDSTNEQVQVENTSNEAVDIGDLAILNAAGAPVVNFDTLPEEKKILEPGESLKLNSTELVSMINSEKSAGSNLNSDSISPSPKPVSGSSYISTKDFVESLFINQEKMTIAKEIIEDGQQIYSKIKDVSTVGQKLREDLNRFSQTRRISRGDADQTMPSNYLEEFNRVELEGEILNRR